MPLQSSATLGTVLDNLGTTLLQTVGRSGDPTRAIDGVFIHDNVDDAEYPKNSLVLGVGMHAAQDVAALLDTLGAQRASALVVRAPAPSGRQVIDAAAAADVMLLELTRGASWTRLVELLRSMLPEGGLGLTDSGTLADMPSGDLFAVANAVSTLLDAPITIEDRSSRVIAFSANQNDTDSSRKQTILGQQVPDRYHNELSERGVFQALNNSDDPVYIEPLTAGDGEYEMPRTALAVRAGDELLGSLWAAVSGPLSAERQRGFQDAAKVVALHILRLRAGADVGRRLRSDLVSTALEGGTEAPDAIGRLDLNGQSVAVMKLGSVDPGPDTAIGRGAAESAHQRERIADALTMHLDALHPRCATALIGDATYAIVPVQSDGDDPETQVKRIAAEFVERTGDRFSLVIGVGTVADDASQLASSRRNADRVTRALIAGGRGQRVASLSDVHMEVLLLELQDRLIAEGESSTGPVERLHAYDLEHRANLTESLRAWLDCFGDIPAAAAKLFIHPNTLRYRLQRIADIGPLDLTDNHARFAAMLQLRIIVRTP
ncbi:MAG: PucR family transcriptional regulator [Propionibacteriaceae bacterium]